MKQEGNCSFSVKKILCVSISKLISLALPLSARLFVCFLCADIICILYYSPIEQPLFSINSLLPVVFATNQLSNY